MALTSKEKPINNPVQGRYVKGDNEAIAQLYDNYFREFLRWCWKHQFKLSDDEINGIYSDAVIVFRDKAWSGELENYPNCSDKTILFSIAKKLIQKHFATNKAEREKVDEYFKEFEQDEASSEEIATNLNSINFEADDEWPLLDLSEHKKLNDIFNQLSTKCQRIFIYWFAYELPTHEVVTKLAYNSEDSLKTQKHKCMKKVKSLIGKAQE